MLFLDPKTTWDYVPECDRALPEEEQTVFVLKHFSAKEDALVQNQLGSVNEKGNYSLAIGTQDLFVLNLGLVDVRNGKGSDGNPVKLTRSMKAVNGILELHPDFINRIPKEIRSELSKAIQRGSYLEVEEIKN